MKRKTTRTTTRPTAKRANPRYLISRDGVEVGIYPGFTSVEAVKRAKAQHGRGTYIAEKIGADMYLGRGGEDIAARERLERQQEYRAHRLSKATRNPRNLATKEEMMRIIMSRKLDVHPYPRGKYPYTVDWKFRDGKIFAIEFPDRTALVDSQYLQRRNGTHIHAEMIDHLDVAKVHNPHRYEFIVIPHPTGGDDYIYPVDTEDEIHEAQEAMHRAGITAARVYIADDDETIETSFYLYADNNQLAHHLNPNWDDESGEADWGKSVDGLGFSFDPLANAFVKIAYKDRAGKFHSIYASLNNSSWRDTLSSIAAVYGKRKKVFRLYQVERDWDTGKETGIDTGIDVLIDTTHANKRFDLDRKNFIVRK